jgi:cell division protein FtsZ
MTLNLHAPETEEQLQPRITVAGVGGAGSNAVGNMIQSNLEGVEFLVCNTDAQALTQSLCANRLQLGRGLTRGLGGGSRPDIGRAAAEEAMDEVADSVGNSDMLFIAAGMGGATGTGAAPVIARAAREKGILTVAVVTKPFNFEGVHRARVAEQGINELADEVDTLIIIPNQNLFRVANEKTTFADAFKMADEVLYSGVRGVTDLVVKPGLINLDFADIRSVMTEMGKAMMGTGEADGENRAISSAEAAISNPLLDDVSMHGARGVLINITGGPDLTLFEVDEAANRIRDEVDSEANIIFGSTYDPSLEGRMRISVVATGIDTEEKRQESPVTLSVVADNQQQGQQGGRQASTQNRGAQPMGAPRQPQQQAQGQPQQQAAAGGMQPPHQQQPNHPQERVAPQHAMGQPQPQQQPVYGGPAQPGGTPAAQQPAMGGGQAAPAMHPEPAPQPQYRYGVEPAGYAAPPAGHPEPDAREEAFIAPEPERPPRRPDIVGAEPGAERAKDPYAGGQRPQGDDRRGNQAHDRSQSKRRPGGLFARVTGVFQSDREKERDQPEPPRTRTSEPRLHGGRAPEPPQPTQPAASQRQSQQPPQQPQPPRQADTGEPVSQPRLSGLDPVERHDARTTEEDQLDIPAFLRRQAN